MLFDFIVVGSNILKNCILRYKLEILFMDQGIHIEHFLNSFTVRYILSVVVRAIQLKNCILRYKVENLLMDQEMHIEHFLSNFTFI